MSDERPALIGRDRHLRELKLLVDGVVASRGNCVVLSGEAGAGKTRLAEEAAALAAGVGVEVAWTTCWSDDSAPLSTWLDLLALVDRQSTPTAGDRLGGGVDPEVARAQLVRALVSRLRDVIGDRPTLLVVDDLQWCDPLSAHAIQVLVGSLRGTPLGVLATCRDGPESGVARLEELARVGRHLVVPPFTDAELGQLAAALTGRWLSPAAVGRLRDRSAGNVLFARELLEGTEPDVERRVAWQGASRSAEMFARRLAKLSPGCRHTLLAASVIGRRFRLDVLGEVVGADAPSTLEFVDEAQLSGLVRPAGIRSWEFSHPLMAEACYGSAGLPRRVRLHRDVGEALERLRDGGLAVTAAEFAHHFAIAAAAGAPEKAVRYGVAAGRESMDQLAYEDAARDFTRALSAMDLCPTDDAGRAELLLELGDAQAAIGNLPAARTSYETVVRLARQHHWPDHLARAALGVGSGPGGFEIPPFDRDQIALLEEAATVATGARRAQVLARLSVALSLDADASRRANLSEEAVALARDTGDRISLGYALASWCDVFAGPADVERRLAAAAEILACASSVGDVRLELLGRRLRIVALLEAGAIDDVDEEIAAFAARADRLGQVVYSWYVPLWQAMRAAMQGRLEMAERLRREATRLGELAHSENAAMLTESQRALIGCEIRNPAGVLAFFEGLVSRWPGYAAMARPSLAYAYAAGGDLGRSKEVLAEVDMSDYTVAGLGSEWLPSLVTLAHAVALSQMRTLADSLYTALAPFGHRYAIDGIGGYLLGSVERPLGLLAALRGDASRAADHLEASLVAHRRIGARLLVAGSLRDAAQVLGDDEMSDEARSLFETLGVAAVGPFGRPPPDRAGTAPASNAFRRDGDAWLVGLNGKTTRVRHAKGMQDIAQLLGRPESEVHSLDLIAEGPTLVSGGLDDSLDASAREQFRARLVDIEADLAEADEHADVARSERLVAERDALVAELSRAYGLGGRARRRGGSAERARSAVTQRIRDAIARVETVDRDLAHHLRVSIRTGTFCSYVPEHPTIWDL